MPLDRALAQVAQDDLEGLGDTSRALPLLTAPQAVFLSYMLDGHDLADATALFAAETGAEPPLDAWNRTAEWAFAVQLFGSDRRALFRALTLALTGRAFRAIASLMDSDKPSGKAKGVELWARIHGLLQDRVKVENPDDLKELVRALRARFPVEDGVYTNVEVQNGV